MRLCHDLSMLAKGLSFPMTLAAALVAAGCGGDAAPAWDVEAVAFEALEVFEVDGLASQTNVNPSGDRYVSFDGLAAFELCVVSLTADVDDRCTERDRSVWLRSLGWSDDGSQVVFTDDLTFRFDEPDIARFDTTTGDIDILTDDGSDVVPRRADPGGDADLDIAPFFGPDGAVHFFRTKNLDRRFELYRLDESGDASPVGNLRLPAGTFIPSAPRPIGDNRWVAVFETIYGREASIGIIDLDDESIETIDLDERVALVDAMGTHVIIASVDDLNRFEPDPFSIVSLETGRDRRIDAGIDGDVRLTGAGFSPDGSFVTLIATDRESNELIGLALDDGRLGDPVVLLTAVEIASDLDLGDERSRWSGVGGSSEFIWPEDGSLTFAVSFEHLAVVQSSRS